MKYPPLRLHGDPALCARNDAPFELGSTFPKLRNSKRVRFGWQLSRRSCEFMMLESLCAFEKVIELYITGKMSL